MTFKVIISGLILFWRETRQKAHSVWIGQIRKRLAKGGVCGSFTSENGVMSSQCVREEIVGGRDDSTVMIECLVWSIKHTPSDEK